MNILPSQILFRCAPLARADASGSTIQSIIQRQFFYQRQTCADVVATRRIMQAPLYIQIALGINMDTCHKRFVHQKSAWAILHVSAKQDSFSKTSTPQTMFRESENASKLQVDMLQVKVNSFGSTNLCQWLALQKKISSANALFIIRACIPS